MDIKLQTPRYSGNPQADVKALYDAFLSQKKLLEYLLNNADNRITLANDAIELVGNELSLKVSADGIISAINLSPEAIQISSSKVNITGFVTFSSLSTAGQTSINGANITTGVIDANRISTEIGQVKELLYIGNQGSTATKEVRFASGARIQGGSDGISPWVKISARELNLIDPEIIYIGNPITNGEFEGTWDFSNATVTGVTAVFA